MGTNSGVIYASCHIGDTHGTAGLAGTNSGSIIGCYQAGYVDGGTVFSIAATNNGLISCPEPNSLYEMQQESFTVALNQLLDTWYSANPAVTRFAFVHSTASYPLVTLRIP